MRKLFATCVVGLLVVGSANGQIRIFFDTEGVGEQEDRGTVDPLSYGNPEVDGTAGPVRLYIYGEFLGENDLWLAINFDITPEGPDATIVGGSTYNHRTLNGRRWSSRGGTINPDGAFEFRSAWIGNPGEMPLGMWNWPDADINDPKHYRRAWDSQGGGLGTTLLGYVDVEGADGSLWMTVEPPIFARLGATPDDFVHFGYGDASVGTGAIGERTTIADATVVPEPAGLMLLGLGVLALRRRP